MNVFRWVQRVMEKPVRERKVRIGFNKNADFAGSPTARKFRVLPPNPQKPLKSVAFGRDMFSWIAGPRAFGELDLSNRTERKGVRNQKGEAPFGPFGFWFLTPFPWLKVGCNKALGIHPFSIYLK